MIRFDLADQSRTLLVYVHFEGQDHLLTSTLKHNITPRIGRLNMY